ncbi:MAG: ferrous iron transporter B [Oceanococcus sp.]
MSAASLNVALVGNPNSGKTALFNRLTGSRQKVANYPGVTVERKEGFFASASGRPVRILDLPGTYSLASTSPDEDVTRAVCHGEHPSEVAPDVIVCVVDATNLRLHLHFVLELLAIGRPMVLALNMMDMARKRGVEIDRQALSRGLGIPVVETIALKKSGVLALKQRLDGDFVNIEAHVNSGDLHQRVQTLLTDCVHQQPGNTPMDERLDSVLLHPVFGLGILAGVMFFMFQAVYAWASPLMGVVEWLAEMLASGVMAVLPDGLLRSLLVDGVIAGVGGVLVFLPQILILFLFILILEESGYLPRAAFLLDRLMVGAGLTGRSFIPLLSSFACAIPGIMATRSIQDPRDRLATIIVAPLMTCSARLPVYALLIGAFVPEQPVASLFNLQGITLFALYFAGIASALAVAYVMKRLRRDKAEHALILELPTYRMPDPMNVLLGLWERVRIFIRRVGGIILSLTILLWFLATFPSPPPGFTGAAIDYSFAGRLGHLMQPLFAPIGFNWQICIALIPGLAAREVAVSSLATVYALSGTDDAIFAGLSGIVASQWSIATAFSMLAWYVFAPQCLSTLAVIKRETNSWSVTLGTTALLFALAYIAALLTYRITLVFST